MTKMKVLFEAGPMIHGQKTGVGYYVSHLVASLGENYPTELALTGYYFNFLGRKHEQLPQIPATTFQKIWLIPGKIISVCRRLGFQPFLELFTQKRTDLVIFTNYTSLPMLKKSKNVLVVYDLSFLDHPEFTQSVNLRYLQRFCQPSIRRADLIITVSEFTRDRLYHYFPDLKAKVVVTPIPPLTNTKSTNVKLSKNLVNLGVKSKQYILYLGTIEPRKNLENLIKAYSLLPESIQAMYSLVLAGGKGWKDEAILAEAANQQAKGLDIILTGYISNDEKDALYDNAACFVLPSHYEGFGMPILEAMQHKVPITLSDIPVFHEVAGKAAQYFDKDAPADIAKVLSGLLNDKATQSKLTAEAVKQLENFSWRENAKQIFEAFQETVK